MKKVIEYKIVQGGDAGALNKKVNELLKKGFILYGNPFGVGLARVLYQAMMKPIIEIETESESPKGESR